MTSLFYWAYTMLSKVPSFWGLCGACANSRNQAHLQCGLGSRLYWMQQHTSKRVERYMFLIWNMIGVCVHTVVCLLKCMSIFHVRDTQFSTLLFMCCKDSANFSTVEPRLSEHLMSPPYLDGRDIWIPECATPISN